MPLIFSGPQRRQGKSLRMHRLYEHVTYMTTHFDLHTQWKLFRGFLEILQTVHIYSHFQVIFSTVSYDEPVRMTYEVTCIGDSARTIFM